MPEPTLTNGRTATDSAQDSNDTATVSTPLELLKAVREVQERRISVWREYDDAFDTFLNPTNSSTIQAPVNGSHNNSDTHSTAEPSAPGSGPSTGRGCAGCSSTTVPLSADLLAQILQITTQALIECGHRLRTIQTELAHSDSPSLATLVDQIQLKENALLRSVVQRDQLRKTTLKPSEDDEAERDDGEEARAKIAQLDEAVKEIRAEITELMQEVYAESLELQLADA
ncbi:hypothetical protein EX895_004888 [Sporisorium graminicola]|uniref:Uncharacterized protein n=1 Tax=Sporisorium graminicola TaxID=280036 RepID=A0A4U7KPB7_9BASI|nr:hypothetical protein EX895_004888 [Sporisorium graminicola]TKY86063.1 hypothetical protein EX895_004888 [Sporisorium graminicola]